MKFSRVARLVRKVGRSRPGPSGEARLRELAFHAGQALPVVPRERRLALLALLEPELNGRGIEYRTCEIGTNVYCAVHGSEAPVILAALVSLERSGKIGGLSVWTSKGFVYRETPSLSELTADFLERVESIVIASVFQERLFRIGRSGGVELLFVDRQGPRLVARQRRALEADWTAAFDDVQTPGPAPRIGVLRRQERRHALDRQPLDVVYTWVDSSDPDWVAARNEWAEREPAMLDSARNDLRYLDRGELRYSLRSLWLYAPFVRNIFIVTNGQVPGWLNQGDARVRVIAHTDLFPRKDDLPTFNSHAIEACLHRIPGLAEHFLYFNDDVFLGRETDAETYFTMSGLIKCRFSMTASIPGVRPDHASTPTEWASYNASSAIAEDFGLRFDRKLKHVPMPLKRSLLEEIEARYRHLIDATRSARFRSPSDIAVPTMLAHYYGISTCNAVEWQHVPGEYLYADTGRADFESKLTEARNGGATFLCMNATRFREIPLDRQASMLSSFLEDMYPLPSPFEKLDEEPPVGSRDTRPVGQGDD